MIRFCAQAGSPFLRLPQDSLSQEALLGNCGKLRCLRNTILAPHPVDLLGLSEFCLHVFCILDTPKKLLFGRRSELLSLLDM